MGDEKRNLGFDLDYNRDIGPLCSIFHLNRSPSGLFLKNVVLTTNAELFICSLFQSLLDLVSLQKITDHKAPRIPKS